MEEASQIPRKQKGFSLIELMVVLLVLGFVTVLFYGIFVNQYRFILLQQDIVDSDLEMVMALDIFVHDLALTGGDPTGSNMFDTFSGGVASLQLSDTDADNLVDQILVLNDRDSPWGSVLANTQEVILYRHDKSDPSNHRFLRNGVTLIDNIQSLTFAFTTNVGFQYSKTNHVNAITFQEWLSFIEIRVTKQSKLTNPATGTPYTRSYMTGVRMLNR